MVIERADHIVNLCEMKFSKGEYAIEKTDDDSMRHKSYRFSNSQKPYMAIHTTLITPFGVKQNMYQYSVQNVITSDNLFKG